MLLQTMQRTLFNNLKNNFPRTLTYCVLKDVKRYSINAVRRSLVCENGNLLTRRSSMRNYSNQPEEDLQRDDAQTRQKLPLIFEDEKIFFSPQQFFIFFRLKSKIPDFDYYEFMEGARQAFLLVTNAMATKDYDVLQNVLDENLFNRLKNRLDNMDSNSNLMLLKVEKEEIFTSIMIRFSVDLVKEDDGSEKKILKIMMHYMFEHGAMEMLRKNNVSIFGSHSIMANMELERIYFDDLSTSDWRITYVNHGSFNPLKVQ